MAKPRETMPAAPDAKPSALLTQGQQIRLESVCLAYRHDRKPEEVIERAKLIAGYVEGTEGAAQADTDQQGQPEALI